MGHLQWRPAANCSRTRQETKSKNNNYIMHSIVVIYHLLCLLVFIEVSNFDGREQFSGPNVALQSSKVTSASPANIIYVFFFFLQICIYTQ